MQDITYGLGQLIIRDFWYMTNTMLIYAYDNLDEHKIILQKDGYVEHVLSFPAPHIHHYHPENDILRIKSLML